ncbi:MAG: YncE family protein, partial [Novosphingobium sp.]
MKKLGLALLPFLATAAPAHASTVFMGSYPDKMLIVDEATGEIRDRITLASGLPTSMRISNDMKKIYVSTITTSGIEVIDTATKKVVNSFSLNTPTTRYRFGGGVPDPSGKFFYTMIQKFEKMQDRWTVSPQMFGVIDLTRKAVVRTAEVPDEDVRFGAGRGNYMLSKDGTTLFLIRDKVLVVDTASLKVKDRLEFSKPEATGIEGVSFGGGVEALRNPDQYVSMFTAQDPYIRNKVYGVGRFDLVSKTFDFRPIGPAPVGGGMAGLQVSKDMKEGWTVVTQEKVGNKRCEFWHLDLTTNLVKNKAEFPCRTRFQF